MIDLIYIRDTNRKVINIIDNFSSIIWHCVYYGVGDFEIYVPATQDAIDTLKRGYYVTREGRQDVGIIEKIEFTFDTSSGFMLTATGRFAKSILERRLIYKLSDNTITPVVFSGLVETSVRSMVNANIINATDTTRNISYIKLGELANLPARIVTQEGNAADTQTSYKNLFNYSEELLQEYGYGAKMTLDQETNNLIYSVYEGTDRTRSGEEPIIFSQEFDNILTADYTEDDTALKNTALCGGEGEGTARKFVIVTNGQTGENRREVFIDASSQSQTYKDAEGSEQQYSDAVYLNMLRTAAKAGLEAYKLTQTFDGEVDIINSGLEFEKDYFIGDKVTIEDNILGIAQNVRIGEVTEVQDTSGYGVTLKLLDY